MAKRAITEADVERALRQRIGSPSPGDPGTIWLRGFAVGGRILKLCVPIDDQTFIISLAWPDE